MSISSLPAKTGHSLSAVVAALRARLTQWRQERGHRIAEQRAIASLQSVEPAVLECRGATACPAAEPQRQANHIDRTEVGPMLAVYLPYWGRSCINDMRDRRR